MPGWRDDTGVLVHWPACTSPAATVHGTCCTPPPSEACDDATPSSRVRPPGGRARFRVWRDECHLSLPELAGHSEDRYGGTGDSISGSGHLWVSRQVTRP